MFLSHSSAPIHFESIPPFETDHEENSTSISLQDCIDFLKDSLHYEDPNISNEFQVKDSSNSQISTSYQQSRKPNTDNQISFNYSRLFPKSKHTENPQKPKAYTREERFLKILRFREKRLIQLKKRRLLLSSKNEKRKIRPHPFSTSTAFHPMTISHSITNSPFPHCTLPPFPSTIPPSTSQQFGINPKNPFTPSPPPPSSNSLTPPSLNHHQNPLLTSSQLPVKYLSRRILADSRPRIAGRFIKKNTTITTPPSSSSSPSLPTILPIPSILPPLQTTLPNQMHPISLSPSPLVTLHSNKSKTTQFSPLISSSTLSSSPLSSLSTFSSAPLSLTHPIDIPTKSTSSSFSTSSSSSSSTSSSLTSIIIDEKSKHKKLKKRNFIIQEKEKNETFLCIEQSNNHHQPTHKKLKTSEEKKVADTFVSPPPATNNSSIPFTMSKTLHPISSPSFPLLPSFQSIFLSLL